MRKLLVKCWWNIESHQGSKTSWPFPGFNQTSRSTILHKFIQCLELCFNLVTGRTSRQAQRVPPMMRLRDSQILLNIFPPLSGLFVITIWSWRSTGSRSRPMSTLSSASSSSPDSLQPSQNTTDSEKQSGYIRETPISDSFFFNEQECL